MPKPDEWSPHESYIVDVLVNCQRGSSISKNQTSMTPTPGGIQPCEPGQKGEPQVVPILLTAVEGFSHLRIFLQKDIRPQAARDTVWKSVLEVQRRFPDGIGLLDPVQNMGIKDEKFLELIKVCLCHFLPPVGLKLTRIVQKIDTMEKKMYSSPLHKDPRLPSLYTLFSKKQDHQARVRDLKKRIQATNDVLQMEELKCRKRVLRRLGFTTGSDIVDMKGRVACEISTGDELLLTELIFNGVFNTLPPEHCAGLLSCFVFTEKVCSALLLPQYRFFNEFQSEQTTRLKEELAAPLRVMQETARRIAKVSKESKLAFDEDEYISSFKVELMDAVVQWCKGASFTEICKVFHATNFPSL